MPGKHARFSPSSSERWINCTASMEKHVNQPTSVYALEGTVCHAIAESVLLNPEIDLSDMIGTTVDGINITRELTDAIQYYVDYVRRYEIETQGELFVERTVNLTTDCWGTPDALIMSETTLDVFDLKMGRGVAVNAEGNTQMRIYALAKIKEHYDSPLDVPPGLLIRLHIVQPRLPNASPDNKWDIPLRDLIAWEQDDLVPAIEAIEDGNFSYGPTEEGCRWCSYKSRCKALAQFNIQAAHLEFEPFVEGKYQKLKDPDSLNSDEIAGCLKSVGLMETWIKSLREEALSMLKQGQDIPEFKVVESRKFRAWDEPEVVKELLIEALDDEAYAPRKIISPAQAEKKLKGLPEGTVQAITNHIFKPEGAPTLAPISDKRPAMKFSAEDEFKDYA